MNEIHNGDYTVEYTIKLDDNNVCIRLHYNGRVFDIEVGPQDLHDPANKTNPRVFEQQFLNALYHVFGDGEPEQDMEVHETADLSEQQEQTNTPASSAMSECGYEDDPLVTFTVEPFLSHGTLDTFASRSSTPCLTFFIVHFLHSVFV
ncbi:hypothetical protein RBB50_006068 [Rhinocladiella similis]